MEKGSGKDKPHPVGGEHDIYKSQFENDTMENLKRDMCFSQDSDDIVSVI